MKPKYFPKNRKPQNEAILPLKLKKPIELRSAIQGSDSREGGQACLYELSLLLACFKETSYSQVACATEIGNFQKCFYLSKKEMSGSKSKEQMSSPKSEVNKLLKKYSVK